MAAERLVVLVGLPPGIFTLDPLPALRAAHPGVEITLAEEPERFAALLPSAEVAIIWPSFAALLAPALGPGRRLRWVQSIPAGVDALLTPELIAAEHVQVTASKGPMAQAWPTVDLYGKTMLILGVGATGGYLARLAQVGLGMRVLGTARTRRDHPHVDRYVGPDQLHGALGEADVVALCLALTPETPRIIDATALAAMKPTAYLINVARGGLADEGARCGSTGRPPGRDGPRHHGGGTAGGGQPPVGAAERHHHPAHRVLADHEVIAFWCENIRRFVAGEPLLGTVDRRARY